ncbi:MAG: TrkA family potassium uptake protein [Victivallaceae bacterium]|nr:TrkA family potassium uptake protein [Victivallaceae bacterium]
MKASYAVFGLGGFGSRLAEELSNSGNNVVAVDIDSELVLAIKDSVTEALTADVTNPDVIRELDVKKFDAVILCMSTHFEAQILALTFLKQEGAGRVIVKTNNPVQKRILMRLGADEVIEPEQDVAERLARNLSMDNIRDMFEFKGSFIADVMVPDAMSGKSIKELDLRNKYNVTVLLLKKPGSGIETVWNPDVILNVGDQLTVIGQEKAIMDLFQK